MATANEEFLDAMIRHQIFMMRLSGKVRNDIYKILDATEADMAEQIRRRLSNASAGLTPANIRRMEALIKVIRAQRGAAWKRVEREWVQEMLDLAASEPAFMAGIVQTVAPVVVTMELPDPALLRAIVTSRPFEGRTMREWARSIAATDLRRIEDQIKIGLTQNETGPQIARRVVGSARLRGRDGVTNITRRNAEAITRTAVNHVSNQARRAFLEENKSVFSKEQYVATLDSRTTPVCQSLDGKLYDVGKGPIPPLHFGCRSLRVGVMDGGALGNRPMKAVTEQQLLREYSRDLGIPTVRSRGALPRGTRGGFDTFARRRTRELTGTVPADVNYATFLGRQSAAFQDDVLGRTKGRLFRDGGMTLDKFVNRAGDELSLSELARRHADAFRAANLDPEDFL